MAGARSRDRRQGGNRRRKRHGSNEHVGELRVGGEFDRLHRPGDPLQRCPGIGVGQQRLGAGAGGVADLRDLAVRFRREQANVDQAARGQVVAERAGHQRAIKVGGTQPVAGEDGVVEANLEAVGRAGVSGDGNVLMTTMLRIRILCQVAATATTEA
jgi:hypothetical protein